MIKNKLVIYVIILNTICGSAEAECKQKCHAVDPDKITIHLIPYSHMEIGSFQTFEHYYYGAPENFRHNIIKNDAIDAGVQYIISSVVESLIEDENKRFILSETMYIYKWWQHQSDEMRANFKFLIDEGRLELVNGGLSTSDEACTHYQAIIDQFTWGFRLLNTTFGACARPKIGWFIDNFGHSREYASILHQMDFQALIIDRIHHKELKKRREGRNFNFIWKTSESLDNSFMFTTILADNLNSDVSFCFDVTCWIQNILTKDNLDETVEMFLSKLELYQSYHTYFNIIVPIGGEFHYQYAQRVFNNIDMILQKLRDHPKFDVIYSTPSCYLHAINTEINSKSFYLSKKQQDFFPYVSNELSHWTGFYTSRPNTKRLERYSNNLLQAAKQLSVYSKSILYNYPRLSLDSFIEALGMLQNHEVITASVKQFVAADFIRTLIESIDKSLKPLSKVISRLLQNGSREMKLELSLCLLSNISICDVSNEDEFFAIIYNPLSHTATKYVRLPVNHDVFRITGPDGREAYDIFDAISSFDYLDDLRPSYRDLVFAARDLPPLGFKLYYIEKLSNIESNEMPYQDITRGTFYFGGDVSGFIMQDGHLAMITLNKESIEVQQNFVKYYTKSSEAPTKAEMHSFEPYNSEIKTNLSFVKAKHGRLVDEVVQYYDTQVTQIIRIYKNNSSDNYIEFDWLIGDLDINEEIATRYTLIKFQNKGTFYTDSNGRELIKRQLNKREDFEYDDATSAPEANYYPITSRIVLRDYNRMQEAAILVDRAQGGTSLGEGQIELMLNRRRNYDNNGTIEGLNEIEYRIGVYTRGQHWLTLSTTKRNFEQTSDTSSKQMLLKRSLSPIEFLSKTYGTLQDYYDTFYFSFEGLFHDLPDNVRILTFEPWRGDFYLLRLEHFYEKNEHFKLSQPVSVDLDGIFTKFWITLIGETNLSADIWLDDDDFDEKFTWYGYEARHRENLNIDKPLEIILTPMQIRTFLIKLSPR